MVAQPWWEIESAHTRSSNQYRRFHTTGQRHFNASLGGVTSLWLRSTPGAFCFLSARHEDALLNRVHRNAAQQNKLT